MFRVRKNWLVVTLAVLTVAAVWFMLLAPQSMAAKAPYVVGAVFSTTGPAASLGLPERDTSRMIEAEVNRKGGIKGHPLKVIIYDDGGKEADCVMLTKRLIEQDKVAAVIGPTRTGTSLAIIDTIEKAKVPNISCAAGIQIVEPVRKWVFKTPQSDVLAVMKIVDYLKPRKIKRAAILCETNAFGEGGKKQLEEQLSKVGITIVANEGYGDKDTDVTTQLTRIKAANPQALVDWGTSQSCAVVTRNFRQLRVKGLLIMSHGVANETYLKNAGKDANGVVFPAGKLLVANVLPKTDPQRAVLIKYATAFKQKYGKTADTFGGHAWDALHLVMGAMEKVGADRAKIRSQIERTKGYIGTGGVFNFSAKDHNGLTKDAFVMVKVMKGKWALATK